MMPLVILIATIVFAIWLSTTSCGQAVLERAPYSPTSTPTAVTVQPVQVSQPVRPAPPAPQPAKQEPKLQQLAWGSVELERQYDLVWDASSGRLFMDPFITRAHDWNRTHEVPAHVSAAVDGTVEALGNEYRLPAGQDWSYTFKVTDPSLGFAWKKGFSPKAQRWLQPAPPAQPAPAQPAKPTQPQPAIQVPVVDQPAIGFCTFNGHQNFMAYDPNKGRLYMDNFLAEAREANKTQDMVCEIRDTKVAGIVRVRPQDVELPAGNNFNRVFFRNDPSFGFAWDRK